MRKVLFKGKSLMSYEELEHHSIPHNSGWVEGNLVDNFITGEVVEACEDYISLAWWVPIEPETIEQIL